MSDASALACYSYTREDGIYQTNGGWAPCGLVSDSNTFVSCCPVGYYCLDNYLCELPGVTEVTQYSPFAVAACTDPEYQDSTCAHACEDTSYKAVAYNGSGDSWTCCATDDSGNYNCEHPEGETFNAPAPSDLYATASVPAVDGPAASYEYYINQPSSLQALASASSSVYNARISSEFAGSSVPSWFSNIDAPIRSYISAGLPSITYSPVSLSSIPISSATSQASIAPIVGQQPTTITKTKTSGPTHTAGGGSSSSSDNSNLGVEVGVPVGVGIPVIAAICFGIWWFLIRKKKPSGQDTAATASPNMQQQGGGYPSGYSGYPSGYPPQAGYAQQGSFPPQQGYQQGGYASPPAGYQQSAYASPILSQQGGYDQSAPGGVDYYKKVSDPSAETGYTNQGIPAIMPELAGDSGAGSVANPSELETPAPSAISSPQTQHAELQNTPHEQ